MQGLTAELMRGLWYVAATGAQVKRGGMLARTLLGEPVLICRRTNGEVFAIRDICPHRGIPLRYGHFDGETVQCSYHGWRFGEGGWCKEIPTMAPGQLLDFGKICAGAYPCVEQQGLIWVFFGEKGEEPAEPPFRLPMFDRAPDLAVTVPFDCSADHAAFGLMDPGHPAYVHRSWWFRHQAAALKPKEKKFEPATLGWAMSRHKVPSRNVAYHWLLGEGVETQISFRLPGFRIEEIEGGKHKVLSVTVITPITDRTTDVIHLFWWTTPVATAIKPLIAFLSRRFLDQDRRVVVQQKEGLSHNPRLMLVPDADTQAKWWMRIKDEWVAHRRDGREFRNPIRETVLRWRS